MSKSFEVRDAAVIFQQFNPLGIFPLISDLIKNEWKYYSVILLFKPPLNYNCLLITMRTNFNQGLDHDSQSGFDCKSMSTQRSAHVKTGSLFMHMPPKPCFPKHVVGQFWSVLSRSAAHCRCMWYSLTLEMWKKKKKQWWKKKRKTDFFSPSVLLVSHNFEDLSSWIKCAFFAQKVFRSFLTFWMFLPCVIQKFSEAQRKEWFLGLFRVEPNNHKLQRHLYNWFVVQLAALFP